MGLRYGSGIHRILAACRKANLPQPLFENFSGGFRIKFLLSGKDAVRGVGEKAYTGGALINRVFDLIREFQGIQRKIIVEKLEIPERTLDRYLAELILAGKKFKVQSSKLRKWRLEVRGQRAEIRNQKVAIICEN